MLKLDIDPRPKIHSLQVGTRFAVSTNFMGDYHSVFKGRGIVFESFREYSPTDDASMIDWHASARSGKEMVREFSEDRNLDIFFLIDSSYSMVFGSNKKLKHEYAAELVSSMTYSILQKGDSVGAALFCDGLRDFVPPTYGFIQYKKILRMLTDPANYDGPCDFGASMKEIIHRLKKGTVLILITDLLEFGDNWQLPLKIATQKFDVIPFIIQDLRDLEMPDEDSQIIVENPYTGEQMLLTTSKLKEKYKKVAGEMMQDRLDILKKINVSHPAIIRTDKEFPPQIVSYFERRKKRWR